MDDWKEDFPIEPATEDVPSFGWDDENIYI